jgi:hypothetical protein
MLRWLAFKAFEAVGFLAPALPESLQIRLAILCGYLAAHFWGLQYRYSACKRRALADESKR